jgi:hypothetical protein
VKLTEYERQEGNRKGKWNEHCSYRDLLPTGRYNRHADQALNEVSAQNTQQSEYISETPSHRTKNLPRLETQKEFGLKHCSHQEPELWDFDNLFESRNCGLRKAHGKRSPHSVRDECYQGERSEQIDSPTKLPRGSKDRKRARSEDSHGDYDKPRRQDDDLSPQTNRQPDVISAYRYSFQMLRRLSVC